jgi:hypothetical protein
LEKEIQRDDIKSVQLTENDWIVTVNSAEAKIRLLTKGIALQNRSVNFFEIDKNITNITIKDAPYELSDQFITSHVAKFGQVVSGSLKKGLVKGTSIETGTRYVQILNCIETLPSKTNFGRFEVPLFAENNRTQCSYCQQTNHPYFRCPNKPTTQKNCFNCKEAGHIARECPHDVQCNYCGENGYIKKFCILYRRDKAREDYGEYANKILEGQQSDEHDDEIQDNTSLKEVNELKTSKAINSNKTVNVVLGTSNCKRLGKISYDCLYASISGAKIENISETTEYAKAYVENSSVKKLIINLGTIDITKCNCDTDLINVSLTKQLKK